MTLSFTIQAALSRHQTQIQAALQQAVQHMSLLGNSTKVGDLHPFYGQMQYHLGWVDTSFQPTPGNPGKLLRPNLLLLAYEAAGAWGQDGLSERYLARALPAAAAIEIIHNFTLVHDDIEDGDEERRHRPTLWKHWGVPQAINTGDGMFALGRLTLWRVLDKGVDPTIAVRLGALLDMACLILAEGQYLDISFEQRLDISVSMYIDMITLKTAALMGGAAEMGALRGSRDEEIMNRLRAFGYALGIAFQVRDDLLGVWETAELGKSHAGDVYRRKKSLPILHALEHADQEDQQQLRTIYQQTKPVTAIQVEQILAIFERTQTRDYCRMFLAEQCRLAQTALNDVPRSNSLVAERALKDMYTLLAFVESATRD